MSIIIAGIIGSTVGEPYVPPPPEPNTSLEVRQWLGDYSGGGSNGDVYVRLSEYPTAGDIPAGAEATVSGNTFVVGSSSSVVAYGENMQRISPVDFAGAISSGTYITFNWYQEP